MRVPKRNAIVQVRSPPGLHKCVQARAMPPTRNVFVQCKIRGLTNAACQTSRGPEMSTSRNVQVQTPRSSVRLVAMQTNWAVLAQSCGIPIQVCNALGDLLEDQMVLPLLQVLHREDQLEDFMSLLKCLREGTLKPRNLSWTSALDRARWQACTSTVNMSYSKETIEFWTIIYILFGNSAISVFKGLAHHGQVISQDSARGQFSPEKADVNFAVPSTQTLRKHDTGYPKCIPPGFIHPRCDV